VERPVVNAQRSTLCRHFTLGAAGGALLALVAAFSGPVSAEDADAHHHAAHRSVEYDVRDLGFFQAREAEERPALTADAKVAAWSVIGETHVVATRIIAQQVSVIATGRPAMNAYAVGMNDRDEVVGWLESSADLRKTRAFVQIGAKLVLLPGLGGTYSKALAIGRSTVVGSTQTAARALHAVEWRTPARARDLGTLPGGSFSRAFGINGRDVVVGESNETLNGKAQAVMWTRGRISKLGLLAGGSLSSAIALNGQGAAVGYADDADGRAKAVRFSQGKVELLGSLGDDPSLALDINDAGQIVGNASVHMGLMKMRGFIWERGEMRELDDLIADAGWVLMGAYRINGRGEILAYGFYEGHTHLCLLIPLTQADARPPG
jgi:uncharacterized membrane protein